MFTPPPSPMAAPVHAEDAAPPPALALAKPEQRVSHLGSRCPAQPKKRSGKRTLLVVLLLPAALVLSAFLHHFMRVPAQAVLDEPAPVPVVKREPQPPPSSAGLLTLSASASQPSLSVPAQSAIPTTTSPLPTVPVSPSLPTPFPQPFDASLSDNFTTTGCQAFFTNFTQDETFRQCRSFAFLLNTSAGFLQAQRNVTLMNNIVWGTCNTSPTAQTCDAVMSNYLSQLNNICQKDIAAENPVALQAQVGFASYTAMRSAACLQDAATNSFCYIEAVAATSPADIYFYALPLGTPVPNTTKPSCSPCVKSVLAVYAQYVNPPAGSGAVQIGAESGNSTASPVTPSPLPVLSKTYPAAARLAVNECGGTYASVGVAQSSAAQQHMVSWAAVLLALVLAAWTY